MSELSDKLSNINVDQSVDKKQLVDNIKDIMLLSGYSITEIDDQRPWGAFLKFDNNEADTFIADFFPGISPDEARLGNENAELSPKILIVSPDQRLSWQYHNRRSEIWRFLTNGRLDKSATDKEQGAKDIVAGEIVHFDAQERHRLIGRMGLYVLVAEIWQHLNPNHLSDESDIVRISDDYSR